MKIEVLHNTIASGKTLRAGETYEVSDKDAALLISVRKAKPAGDGAKAKKADA